MADSNLWAPWRIDYILAEKNDSGCVFCELHKQKDDHESLILKRSEYAYVVLNRFPYSSCHLLVVPFSHVQDLAHLAVAQYQDLMFLLRESIAVLRQAVRPAGINAGINLGA